jgi:agmatinase
MDAPSRQSVVLLGVPLDCNSSYLPGTAHAPGKIREALRCDASNAWSETGVDTSTVLIDEGDLTIANDTRSFPEIEAAAAAATRRGKPLFLGGDHSITYALVKGVARERGPLTIVHFDAHPDLYAEYEGNRHSHACPFARILEEKLATRLIQVGIRTLNTHQKEQAEKFGVEILGMNACDLAAHRISGPIYISFDLDALDPAFAPGVSHREPGGLSVRQGIRHLHAIPASIVAADLVEYNPAQDISDMSATVCAKLVKELAGVMARS